MSYDNRDKCQKQNKKDNRDKMVLDLVTCGGILLANLSV